MAGETIMSITYGLDVLPKDDPYLATLERGNKFIATAALPGSFLVNTIPALKYIPDWMPFAGFKRYAKESRKIAVAVVEQPFDAMKREVVSNSKNNHVISEGYC
jgi:hypothetical protein